MRPIACKDCWTRFDATALACPQCGRPAPRRLRLRWWLWASIASLLVALPLALVLAPRIAPLAHGALAHLTHPANPAN